MTSSYGKYMPVERATFRPSMTMFALPRVGERSPADGVSDIAFWSRVSRVTLLCHSCGFLGNTVGRKFYGESHAE